MAHEEDNGTGLAVDYDQQLKEPEDFVVILLNDDYTTMDFVVMVLMSIFKKSENEATDIMEDVHLKGRGTVGRYPWDIAATKADQVHVAARKNEFPLRRIVEKG